jgi:hypothetical protein
MKQIIYAMQFKGQGGPGASPNVLKAATSSPSSTVSPEPKLKSGAVMWRVDGGDGQFAGASGYITSNFTMDEAGHVTDNQFGVIYVK